MSVQSCAYLAADMKNLLVDDDLHTFDGGVRDEKHERDKVVVVKKLLRRR